MRNLRAVVMALALCGTVQGCRSGTPFDEDTITDSKAHLVVKNESINQMDVYAVADGVASRVGTVSGLGTQRFALDPSLYQASDFSIVGTPLGGNGRASTGGIRVSRGQTVFFTIRSVLRTSTVSIQNP